MRSPHGSSARPGRAHRTVGVLLASAVLLCAGCREGSENINTILLTPQIELVGGCASAPPTFGGLTCVYPNAGGNVIDGMSRLAGSVFEPKLFLTGTGGTLLELEFTMAAPDVPLEREILIAGQVDAEVITPWVMAGMLPGGVGPASLSGLTLLDAQNLVVAEHTTNTLLLANTASQMVEGTIGFPSTSGGFASGDETSARFSFDPAIPVELVTTRDTQVYVADVGNHALREVVLDMVSFVTTVAGTGAPGHADGGLTSARLDTPTGLSVSCAGTLIVAEQGPMGHRLRAVTLGDPGFFGGSFGSVVTLAGDGTEATTQGTGAAAQLAQPDAPLVTTGGQIYWMDTGTGILRRLDEATGEADCPLFADCATAVTMGGMFSGPGPYTLAATGDGTIYVLDVTAAKIFRVDA